MLKLNVVYFTLTMRQKKKSKINLNSQFCLLPSKHVHYIIRPLQVNNVMYSTMQVLTLTSVNGTYGMQATVAREHYFLLL